MADSFELKAIITAVDKLSGPLKGMQKQLKGFKKELSGIAVGAGAAGATILGALAGATMQAVEFEKTMADVRKVVDGLDSPEAFRQMQDDVLELSTTIPLAATEIADIVAQAGQSGIDRSELTQFAADAAKIGVAWDLSGKEAGKTLAVWRTAFGLTQKEVVDLADKVNYLGNTGPANSASIAQVVTELGGISKSAHVASGDVAALASTIIGVGIGGDVAQTGIKNLFSGLTSASSGRQAAVANAIGWSPDKLAKGMVKDARGTILNVLDKINKLPEWKKSRAMEFLFGKESAVAIVPLLTNLDTLKKNFNKVTDAQLYAGAAASEYATASDTAAADLALMRNEIAKISVEVGREFLPIVRDAVREIKPLLKTFSQFIKDNPEAVRNLAKLGLALAGTAAAMGAVSRAVRILNFAMNMSPAKALIGLLVVGAYEIIDNWDEIGPVIKDVWHNIDEAVNKMGGWESAIKSLGVLAAIVIGIGFIKNVRSAVSEIGGMSSAINGLGGSMRSIGKISMIGGLIELGLLAQKFEQDHPWLIHNVVADALNSGFGLNDYLDSAGKKLNDEIFNLTGFRLPRADGYGATPYTPSVGLSRPVGANGGRQEIKVTFDNAPPGMRVAEVPKMGDPLMRVTTDVGYSPFRKPQ